MESLITVIQNFGITQDEKYLDNSLDVLIKNFSTLSNNDADDEWGTLKSNYSKLKYLNELINFYHIPDLTKFKITLGKFMESIDILTQKYLRNITWDGEENEIEETILKYLEESLNSYDPILKMSKIIKAYSMLVPIIEIMRNEKWRYTIDDREFLNKFK
jgi:hypothetical protein